MPEPGDTDVALSSAPPRAAFITLFIALLVAFGLKYSDDFGARAAAMNMAGGPFGTFDFTARFHEVGPETAAKVKPGDEMVIRSWRLARVVSSIYEAKSGAYGELEVVLKSPNWLRYYFEPLAGTEVVFKTEDYSLEGSIERAGSAAGELRRCEGAIEERDNR